MLLDLGGPSARGHLSPAVTTQYPGTSVNARGPSKVSRWSSWAASSGAPSSPGTPSPPSTCAANGP